MLSLSKSNFKLNCHVEYGYGTKPFSSAIENPIWINFVSSTFWRINRYSLSISDSISSKPWFVENSPGNYVSLITIEFTTAMTLNFSASLIRFFISSSKFDSHTSHIPEEEIWFISTTGHWIRFEVGLSGSRIWFFILYVNLYCWFL